MTARIYTARGRKRALRGDQRLRGDCRAFLFPSLARLAVSTIRSANRRCRSASLSLIKGEVDED
jgi:hypothetical protein